MCSKYQCSLLSLENRHDPIDLPHGTPVIIGRTPATKIRDTKISRKQVELTADCNAKFVALKQLGTKPCKIDEKELSKGDQHKLSPGQIIEILAGSYPYRVEFTADKFQDGSVSATNSSSNKSIASYFKKETDSPQKKRKHSAAMDDDEQVLKKSKIAQADDSEDEEMAETKRKLQRMKETFAKQSENNPQAQTTAPQSAGSAENDGSNPSKKVGVPTEASQWEQPDPKLYTYISAGTQATAKIAAFDIDGTIITTQSGKVFPTHPGDWRILYPEIPKKMKTLHAEGYKVVFFTNQKGIENGKVKIADFKQKVETIIKKMGIPIQVFISTGSGRFRKPGLGMWNYLTTNCNDGITVDPTHCFYVGDAAGRPEKWAAGKKKDFSCSDRLFAMNAGIRFLTPEEYFLGQRAANYKLPEFCAKDLDPQAPLLLPASARLTTGKQEVVVMVGCPASGKSHFVKQHLLPKGYVHVNRDTLKTWQKCVEVTKSSLSKGQSVVVDNTNPDVDSRKRYTDVARKAGVECRCFVMNSTFEHAKHNERFREMTDPSHEVINQMVMNSWKSKFKAPEAGEGFSEIVKVNIIPSFKNQEHHKLYHLYLMEK